MRFKLTGRLPGENDIIRASRGHWAIGARQKKTWMRQIAQQIVALSLPIFEGRLHIYCYWTEPNRRRDLDNIGGGLKVILDALVLTHRIAGDGQHHVVLICHQLRGVDKEHPGVDVEIIEHEGGR